jgi:hypothetical protein
MRTFYKHKRALRNPQLKEYLAFVKVHFGKLPAQSSIAFQTLFSSSNEIENNHISNEKLICKSNETKF